MSSSQPSSFSPNDTHPPHQPIPWSTYLRIRTIRFLQTIGRYFDLYLSVPLPRRPSFTLTIPSTVGSRPGNIKLLFYTPPTYSRKSKTSTKHPILVNFHGGGFIIGHAADDGRWATEVLKRTEGVVVSVDYRLGPESPFPIGLEDCVSAVLYLWSHAEELNLDISRTALSGFSAGGNFCYTAAFRLHEEVRRLKKEGKMNEEDVGKLVSTVAFYPPTDMTRSREERNSENPNLMDMIPPALVALFSGAYVPEKKDVKSPLLSPMMASDGLLREALPKDNVMITCWGDGLLTEGERFRERLKGLGMRVDGYTVPGVKHGWDKWPSYWKGDARRDEAYKSAAESLKEFWT